MKIEYVKCEKCGCDKLIVNFQRKAHLYVNPSEVYPEQLEIRCPKCGSELIIRYNEPDYNKSYMVVDTNTSKRLSMIFTNVEGYIGNVVRDLEDNEYVFFSRVGQDHKEYIMNDNNKLRSENAVLKNKIKELEMESKQWHKMYDELVVRNNEIIDKRQNDIAVAKAEMQDKIDSLKSNLDYHVKQENYFKEQYHKYKEENKELKDDLSTSQQLFHNAYEECELKQQDIKKLTNLLNNYSKEVDDLTLEIDVLRANHNNHIEHLNKEIEEKDKKLEKVIKSHNNTLDACNNYENRLKEELNKVTKELEAYKKQCSRLEHEKINAWTSAHDTLNNANEKINKLEKENISLKNEYQSLSDEYVKYQMNTKDDNSYYKLWKDLADKYCELEDKYNKVYVECQKYKKYWEEIVKCIEPVKIDKD